jgi:hypothetical protein
LRTNPCNNQGFYTTFRTLFNIIAAEEAAISGVAYPSFGTSNSTFSSIPALPTDIRKFYSVWMNFGTEKEFPDQYRFEEGMDRRDRRAMDADNKKFRDASKREYNESVRVSPLLSLSCSPLAAY